MGVLLYVKIRSISHIQISAKLFDPLMGVPPVLRFYRVACLIPTIYIGYRGIIAHGRIPVKQDFYWWVADWMVVVGLNRIRVTL